MPDADAGAKRSVRSPSARWLPLTISLLAAALVIGLGYSALQYLRSSTFNDERAFRVLGEIVGQFHNFENALIGLLALVPSDAAGESDVGRARGEEYLRTLALGGKWRLDFEPCGAGGAAGEARLAIDASSADRPFSVMRCVDGSSRKGASKSAPREVRLTGYFSEQAPKFLSQQFFDTVIVAAADGSVLVNIRGAHREAGVQLHETRDEHLIIADASGLLRYAALQEAADDRAKAGDAKSAPPAGAAPSHPIVMTDTIAGDAYRVFVHAFEPDYPLALRKANEARHEPRLFIVGLKRQEVLQPMLDALGAGGVLTVTLLVLLAILAWPLLGLKFAAPQEAISPTQVFAVLIGLVLIPSVLTVAGFSMWSRYRLTVWAEQYAERYARNLEAALLQEMSEDVRILDHLGAEFLTKLELRRPEDFERGEENLVCVAPAECPLVLAAPARRETALSGWSHLRSGAPLNMQGRSSGLRFNLFGAPSPNGALDLHDREYFQAIQQGEEWRPDDVWGAPSWSGLGLHLPRHGFVAQRLFNRSDAARALQITTPLHAPSGERIGMVTADSRAYAFTTAVRSPVLRFAIVDGDGSVLFHSDDSRSLAENLLVETERNEALRNLLAKRASRFNLDQVTREDHFAGRYLGAPHRFHYRAVSGLPWGVVVFYPKEELTEAVLHTAVATLATYFAFATALLIVFGVLVLLAPGRLDRAMLALVWPKWSSRHRYRTAARVALCALAAATAYLLVRLRLPQYAGMVALALIVAAIGAVAWAMRVRRTETRERPMSVEAYERWYGWSLMAAMIAVAVLPSIWLACDYFDTSLRALMRTELQQAAADVQHRRRVIATDVQRFLANAPTHTLKVDASTLSERLAAPGYAVLAEPGERRTTWRLLDVPSGLWLARCGPPALGPVRRTIWMLSTASQARRERFGGRFSSAELRLGGGVNESGRAGRGVAHCNALHGAAYWLRRDDGSRIVLALPLAAGDATSALVRDPELHFRVVVGAPLVLASVIALVMLSLMLLASYVARRLFGIRIPFAGRFDDGARRSLDVAALLDAELELLALKKQHGAAFTTKDESDWRAARCRPLYEGLWAALDPREQLLVHQLAHGRFANPDDRAVLESLLRRGYLKLWPWPRIADAGFAEFLRASEVEHNFAQMQREAAKNWWQRIRTPLLIVVIVIAALLMWLAGSAMQILSATLAGVAALFSSLTQVTSFARSAGKPASGDS